MLGFPNRADTATLSGGSWVAGLPLSLLQTRIIGETARTTNAALTSTKFDIDQGVAKKTQLIALRNHNFSIDARYRVTASASPAFSVLLYDSAWTDVWSVVYPYGSLEWEDNNFWSGRYAEEEIAGYTTELDHILPARVLARYWRIEIDDTTNPAGYLQVGRLFIGPAWQPVINMSHAGAALGWETKTSVQEAKGGAEYFDYRTPYRVQRFSLDAMQQDEAFSHAFDLMRRAGIDKEVLFIHDPDDTAHALRRRFLARLRALNAIEYPYGTTNSAGFEVKELL